MRIPNQTLLAPAALAAMLAVPPPAMPQAVALPLRGEGEIELPGQRYDLRAGSVLLQADSTVKMLFVDGGSLRTAFAGEWRRADARTIELAVLTLLGDRQARGAGRIRFRPDGAIDGLEVRGRAHGREFRARFTNATTTAALPVSERREPQAAPPADAARGGQPWGGTALVVDATRRGEGLLRSGDGDYRLDRARLRLGQNDEFELVVSGETRQVLSGTWSGDPRFGPVPLEVREASGRRIEGTGRAWIRDRSWDRDFSFDRLELDGWNGDEELSLYFEAKTPVPDDLR